MFKPARKKLTRLCLGGAGSLLLSTTVLHADEIIFSQKIYGPSTNIISIDSDGKVVKITDSLHWRDVQPNQDKTGNITFSSNRQSEVKANIHKHSDNYNIFYYDAKTQQSRALTLSTEQDTSPKFSSQAENISFVRSYPDKSQALCLINSMSKKITVLYKAKRIIDHAWHPTKNIVTISVENTDEYQLVQFDLKAKITKVLKYYSRTDINNSFQFDSLAWSPDGKWLAYVRHPLSTDSSRQLWLLDAKNLKTKQLSKNYAQVQRGIDWSSDSQSLLYSTLMDYEFGYDEHTRDRFYKGSMPVFISTIDGTTKQITHLEGAVLKPKFSPDQKEFAFLYSKKLGDAPHYELRSSNIEGTNMKTLSKQVSRSSELIWN